jgi:hypothetical protein
VSEYRHRYVCTYTHACIHTYIFTYMRTHTGDREGYQLTLVKISKEKHENMEFFYGYALERPTPTFSNRFAGTLLGLALGDSLASPFDGWSNSEICIMHPYGMICTCVCVCVHVYVANYEIGGMHPYGMLCTCVCVTSYEIGVMHAFVMCMCVYVCMYVCQILRLVLCILMVCYLSGAYIHIHTHTYIYILTHSQVYVH